MLKKILLSRKINGISLIAIDDLLALHLPPEACFTFTLSQKLVLMCKASATSRNTEFRDSGPLFTEHQPPAKYCPGPVRSHVLWICLVETQDKATFWGQRRNSLKTLPLQMPCSFKERSCGIPS